MAGVAPRSILVVEELAHWGNGHFPVQFLVLGILPQPT